MARRRGRTRSRGARATASAAGESDAGRVKDGAQIRAPIDGRCALCERRVERYTVHHLIPKARGGKFGPTAPFCSTCHRQVHAMFSETTLAEDLYNVELLRANHRVASFLRWMRKQRGAAFRVRRSRERG